MSEQEDRPLLIDKLCSGDRPSILVAGMAVAHEIAASGVSVLAADAIGRLVPVSPSDYKILRMPRIPFEDLDKMTEDEAIQIMVKENREEAEIISYLAQRGIGNGD
jgi:hypothetical protein